MASAVKDIGLILTADQEYFDFQNPDPRHFSLTAIAQGLSNTCRFAGQCKRYYSVAEHSVHVSNLVSQEHARHALLHDAAEAFMGDIPKPLKNLLPDYQELERKIEKALFTHYGLPEDIPDEVKEADLIMLEVERKALFDRQDEWELTRRVANRIPDLELVHMGPWGSRILFLNRAKELGMV